MKKYPPASSGLSSCTSNARGLWIPLRQSLLLLLTLFAFGGAALHAEHPDGGEITMMAKGVPLRDMVSGFALAAEIQITIDENHPRMQNPITINLKDARVLPALRGLLGQNGFILIEDQPGSKTYTVLDAKSPAGEAHTRAAQETIAALDIILADLENGKTDLAKGRLEVLRQSCADRIPPKAEEKKDDGLSPDPKP